MLEFSFFPKIINRGDDGAQSLMCFFSALQEAFNLFDVNQDGFITQDELYSVISFFNKNLSELEVKQMIAHNDIDGKFNNC